MKKEKVYRVANRTMDEDSYKEFVSLTYEKQLETIYEGMSPKNMEEAEKALKDVRNGGRNIGDRVSKEVAKIETSNRTGDNKALPAKSSDSKS